MSPASSGSLQVERYIGACLISSQHIRINKNQQQQQKIYYNQQRNNDYYITRNNSPDGWAGGMPLISFANHSNSHTQRRNITTSRRQQPQQSQHEDNSRCPSPRELAVHHTQGLPLILTGRNGHHQQQYNQQSDNHRRIKKYHNNNNNSNNRGVPKKINNSECKDNHHHQHPHNVHTGGGGSGGIDTLSVASDESSGSNHSETSLPRIIKPRKRRKKDRKPHPHLQLHSQSPIISTSTSISTHLNSSQIQYFSEFNNNNNSENNLTSDNNNDSPQLHHRFEDVLLANLEIDNKEELSNCQCRYCDPNGQIWDVDKHCYSPFLTVPPFIKKQLSIESTTSSTSSSSTSSSSSSSDCYTDSNKLSSALQSQCSISSTFSLDLIEDNCNNKQQQCLEISTQIVTSPNGHRDLEIRLFSSDTNSKLKENDANLSPEE